MAGTVEKISVALPTDMVSMARRVVDVGDYASSSEVVREALREWKTRRLTRVQATAELRRLWDEGITSGSRKDLNIAAVKRRGRARLQRSC